MDMGDDELNLGLGDGCLYTPVEPTAASLPSEGGGVLKTSWL